MKICMITDAWLPIWGGGQEHILQISKILEKKYGYKVDIIAPTLINKNFKFNNFIHRIWFTFWVFKFVLTSNYDLYHSHMFSTSIFLSLAKLRGKKTAITVHGLGKDLIGGGLLNTLGITKLLMNLILYVWPYDYKFSVSKLNGFIAVGNGVNVEEFDKFPKTKNSKFRVFWIGRKYDPVKGLIYLEKAVSGLDVMLDIADNVYGDEKIKRFKQADVFVLPSLSEGLPIVLLEAMAARLPIIATDVGDCRQLVEQAKAGIVVEPADARSLKKAIIKMMKNTDKYGENGYEFVKKNYTWEKVVERMYAF